MKSPHFTLSVLMLTLVAAAGGWSMPAAAALNKKQISSPTGLCQAALPNFEGNLRKRPLAIANEGTASAFITCSFPAYQSDTLLSYTVRFHRLGSTNALVSCTAVNGSEGSNTNIFVTKITPVLAGQSAQISWIPAEGISQQFPTSISCELQPNVSIGDLEVLANFGL